MLSITVNTAQLDQDLADVSERQVPFAASAALNITAKQFQKVQIEHQHEIFTVRRSSWLDNAVKITHFATKAELWATVGIHPPGGDGRADILTKFEDQTVKLPFKGSAVAVPTLFIRRSKSDLIPRKFFPGALNLRNVGNRVLGDQRTFMITTASGQHLILERYGKGKRSGTAVIWTFKPSVAITPDLDFEQNAEAVVDTAFFRNFEDAFAQALSTARVG